MRTTVLILAALLGCLVLSANTWRVRKANKELSEALDGSNRYVDMGIRIVTVRADESGRSLLDGKPKMVVLREEVLGGMVDTTASPPRMVGRSKNPITWYVDEVTEAIVLHGDDLPPRVLVEGAMGAGKSTALTQWCGVRAVLATGAPGEIGVTAPTTVRLGEIKRALFDMFPRSWWKWKERDQIMTLANGVTLRLVSTHQASQAEGSRIQGFNWFASANDEIQDSLDVDGDIEARGRAAPDGLYKRFATATVKDSPDYRTYRDRLKNTKHAVTEAPLWLLVRKRGIDSPFVHPDFWVQLSTTMSQREYGRKVLALDLPSELRVYHSFDRDRNVRPLQQVPPWPDVTRRELSKYGRNFDVLVGYDPGRLFDVSILLKAYQPPIPARTRQVPDPRLPDPVWFVVGEVTTEQSTTEHHCRALLKVLREQFGCNLGGDGAQAFVRGDPATSTGTDENRPDMSVYTVFRQHGLEIKAGAYAAGSVKHGVIPKEARIDMVNTLFHSADGSVRLCIQCDDRKQARAPRLVEALEMLERDGDGRAEMGKKDRNDKTHWPCALGIALWSIEKPRMDARRAG